ncbi:RNA polymerase sigma factor [Sphingomonas faeni]|uniref:RNA polymerase sigma factor n=1 Tax=Sphingomonas faeni TaxID=185950 RepID=UPI0027804E8C|nr:sigma-70 family RNA polymerase sigma factor [Sphingomonas faeni]MDQ0839340.1 RNA polymerase sigma factor (sigma-70 family) [Sphingomonas faeni]
MSESDRPDSGDAGRGHGDAELRTMLVVFFRRRGEPPQEVDDLVQEVLLRLSSRRSPHEMENLAGYAIRTAESVLVDRSRRRSVRHHHDHVEFDAERDADQAIGPDRIVASRQELAVVVAALSALPERTRTIFVLRRLEGMRYRDIADRLGLSISAVEKHMVRASLHLLKFEERRT